MIDLPSDTSFSVAVTSQTDQSKLEDVVKRFLPDWNYSTGGGKWAFSIKDPARRQMEDNAVSQAVETIRNRVDEFGVAEPLIAREGADRILVQLPGIDDPKRVKDLIKNTAFLELSLVEKGPSSEAALKSEYPGGVIPPQFKLVEAKAEPGSHDRTFYVVRRQAVITGRDLKNARPTQAQFGNHSVTFFLTASGSQKFGEATGANIGKRLAIVLDNRVQSAPSIKDRITETGVIEGTFTPEEANDLALVLRAGALPAGPRLPRGADRRPFAGARLDPERHHGVGRRGLPRLHRHGRLLPARRMERDHRAHYERGPARGRDGPLRGHAHAARHRGLHPDDRYGRRLERPRLRAHPGGAPQRPRAPRPRSRTASPRPSRRSSTRTRRRSSRPCSCFQFGTGPVKGFAVTLIIGLLISMFTAVFVSHTIFELEYGKPAAHVDSVRSRESKRTMEFFRQTNIDFLKYKWWAIGASWALIVARSHHDLRAEGAEVRHRLLGRDRDRDPVRGRGRTSTICAEF